MRGTKRALDGRAVFHGIAPEYLQPWQPQKGQEVCIRLRVRRGDVRRAELVCGERRLRMSREARAVHARVRAQRESAEALFDYYRVSLRLSERSVHYFFRIRDRNGRWFCYTRQGISRDEGIVRGEEQFYLVPGLSVPDWSCGRILYQIFPDRFCNGDPDNDVLDDEYSYGGGHVQRVRDWRALPEADDTRRHYGGDLQGIIDHLDDLQALGVEGLYLNPVFVSPSNHRYDTQDYAHVDPHLGRIVRDGGELLAEGDQDNRHARRWQRRVMDPANLQASDEVLRALIRAAHERGMRVILDGVFNHCGSLNRWLDRGGAFAAAGSPQAGAWVAEGSPFHDFFTFSGGSWPGNDHYESWWGCDTLPKLAYEQSGRLVGEILETAARWVGPNEGADGWRLDVAADLGHSRAFNHRFWQAFRSRVRGENPEALILAENYTESEQWLQGQEWDTIMNYEGFLEPVSWFLTGMEKHSDEFRPGLLGNAQAFAAAMSWQGRDAVPVQCLYSAMNQLSNHDHSRFLTRTNHRVGRLHELGSAAASEGVSEAVLLQGAVLQMTWPGSPCIYYGDEAGLAGFTDPDNRRTYPWGEENQSLLRAHRELTRIHRSCSCLRRGAVKFLYARDGIAAFARFDERGSVIVLINASGRRRRRRIALYPGGLPLEGELSVLFASERGGWRAAEAGERVPLHAGSAEPELGADGALILYAAH